MAISRIQQIIYYFTLKPNNLEETNSLADERVDFRTFFQYDIKVYADTEANSTDNLIFYIKTK